MKRSRGRNSLADTSKKVRKIDADRQQDQKVTESQDAGGSQIQKNNSAFRNGKILRMRLINFMCHSNLVVEFNRHVNLIVGNNGSGKSAILTALVIGLGAKASATSRSTNLKKLIKNGEQTATIEIEIANDGPNPYEPMKYGKKIIVVRQISQSSASGYKIKNETGYVVTKNRDDLMKILFFLNIQTDNLVFVLNQDAARSFLRELDPKKNYELFLKATQIETIVEKLDACGTMYRSQQLHLECRKKQNNVLKEEIDGLQNKYQCLQSSEAVKEKIAELSLKKHWLQVKAQDERISEMQKNITDLISQSKKLKEQIKNKDFLENELKSKIEAMNEELTHKQSTIVNENQILNNLKNELSSSKDLCDSEDRQLKGLEKMIKHYQEQATLLENHIQENDQGDGSAAQSLRLQNKLKMTELEKENAEIAAMIVGKKSEVAVLAASIQKLEEEFHEMQFERKSFMVALDDMGREVKTIQASAQDTLSVYGRNMGALREKIEEYYKAGKFSELPRGPLGHYLEVPNQNWRSVLESIFGRLMHCFMVNNDKDREVLSKILSEFKISPPIITGKFHKSVYDVSRGCVEQIPGTYLVMNQIKCADPVVLNCFIDKCHIETILLTEDQNLAAQLTEDEENVPVNLTKIIVLNPLLEYFPAPLYRIYSLETRSARYLQVSTEERKRQLLITIKNIEGKKSAIENSMREKKKILESQYRLKADAIQTIYKHENNMIKNSQAIEELQNVAYPRENETEHLKNELEQQKIILETEQAKLAAKKDVCEKCFKVFQAKEIAFQKQAKRIKDVEQTIQTLITDRDNQYLEIRTIGNKTVYRQEENEKIITELKKLRTEYNAEKKIQHDLTAKAEQCGDCLETDDTEEYIDNQLKSLARKLRKTAKIGEGIEYVKAMIESCQSQYEKSLKSCEGLKNTLSLFRKARIERFQNIMNLKRHMSLRVSFTFNAIMRLRNHMGKIEILHQDQVLKVTVIPRDKNIQNAVSNTKSLSGGERSFSTVALLISLWSCVDHPFYCLDEYDVFTDQVNRQMMTQLLLKEARQRPKCQYIFLTPQDISFVYGSDTVNIIKLADPDRENSHR